MGVSCKVRGAKGRFFRVFVEGRAVADPPASMTAEELEQQAQKPKVVEVDGQHVEQHSLPDQIAFDRYLAAKKAAERRTVGVRFAKMVAGGAVE